MDVEDIKNVDNNLPNNVTSPSNNGLTEGLNDMPGNKKPGELESINSGELQPQNTEDVLDPEGEDVLNPEDENNSNRKKNDNSEESGTEQPGETEDVLDPEAEDDDKKDDKDDNEKEKNDTEDSGEGDSNSSGESGDGSSDVNSGGDSSGSGSDSSLGSGSEGGSSPTGDTGMGSGGSTPSGMDSGMGSGGSGPSSMGSGGAELGGGATPATGGTPALTGGAEMGASTTAAGTSGAGGAAAASSGAGGAAAASSGAGGAAAASSGAASSASAGIFANPYVLLVIIIIIIIIGLIGFVLNMPGLLLGKIKQIVQGLCDNIQSMFANEAEAFINDEDVTKLAQYLVDMDYDLIAYGFVRANIDNDYETFLDLEEDGYYVRESGRYSKIDSEGNEVFYDGYYYNSSGNLMNNANAKLVIEEERFTKDKYGIRYWAADGEHDGVSHTKGQIAEVYDGSGLMLDSGATADDSLLRAYLMADYRMTVLRNDDEGLLNELGDYLDKTFGGAPNAWSKGMIKVFKKYFDEEEQKVVVENLFSTGGILNAWWTSVDIKDGTKLSLRNEWFNRPMEFELDGWTGRYGLSLEFLLSLHLGTMAPDLVTAMLQCFDTEVQVYIEAIDDAKVIAKYKDYKVDEFEESLDNNNEEVTIQDLNAIINESDENYVFDIEDGALIEWLNELTLTKNKCYTLLKKSGLSSPPNCIYTAVSYVILNMQSRFGEWFETQNCNYLSYNYDVIDPILEEVEYRVKEDTDAYYTAKNSLYSLRLDKGLGYTADPTTTTIITDGLINYVEPGRTEAKNKAKEFGFTDVEPSIENGYTGTGSSTRRTGDNDKEVIGKDNYVYRIDRNVEIAEWPIYGYLNGDNEFVQVTEDEFKADETGTYEETTGYYNSYIYKIYQTGIVDDASGDVIYFKNGGVTISDGKEDSKGTLVHKFTLEFYNSKEESIGDRSFTIYYNPNKETDSGLEKFDGYNESGTDQELVFIATTSITVSAQLYVPIEYECTCELGHEKHVDYYYFKLNIRENTEDQSYTFDIEPDSSLPSNSNTTDVLYSYWMYKGDQQVTYSIDTIKQGNGTVINDEYLYDVLYMNFVVRDKTLEELVNCGLLEKLEDGTYIPKEDAGKCSTDTELTKCCTICQRYVKAVIRELARIQDTEYSYFQPYIARVVGSWFRDTYFIIPEKEDGALIDYYGSGKAPVGSYGSNGKYVKVDEEYLASSGEYWTDYEMKKIRLEDEEGNPILDKDGNEQFIETDAYQLYYLNPDGTTSDKKLEEWLLEEHVSNLTGETKIFTSKEEAEKDGYVFVKRAKVMSLSDVKDLASGEGGGRDLDKKPYMEGTLWSAYAYGLGTDTGWIKIQRGEVENINEIYNITEDKGEFYYRLTSSKSIEQEEDAIRTETNVTVKNLFRYRQYYIYDGSIGRAEAIQADRLKVFDLITAFFADSSNGYSKATAMAKVKANGRYASRLLYSYDTDADSVEDNQIAESWLEWQLDMYYRANNENAMSDAEKELFKLDELCAYGVNKTYTNAEGETETYLDKDYYTLENHSLDPRDRNLISTVNITKSSLDAFSILENVNTLDADYQYRDFKELIVELNYFDKEDLSETIEEVFTWLVPTYTSNWPILGIDKQNNEYGTLLHSQESIDFLIKVYEKLVEEEKALAATNGGNNTEIDVNDNTNTNEDFDMSKVYYIGDSWFVGLRNSGLTESSSDYFTAAVGKKAGDAEYNNIQVKSDASCIVIMLGLNGATTQNEMKALLEDLSTRYNNKNIYVLKVFHVGRNYTVMDKDQLNALIDTYNQDIQEFCSTKSNLKFVDATDGIIDEQGYISPTYEAGDGMHLISYLTLYKNIEKAVQLGEGEIVAQTENEKILELLKAAEAYQEGDAVISPATGKIIAYGEHERINVYTQEKEKVGYVKIEVMSYGEDFTNANKSYFTLDMMPSELTQEEKEEAVKGLNSFYKEYRKQCEGYVLTIDGIDITDLKNGFTGMTNEEGEEVDYESLCQYEKDDVVALYNSKEQKAKEAESEARVKAPSFISYNANYNESNGEYFAQDELGGYYVKEGAYLGTVQAATTRTGEKAEINAGAQKENPNIENPEDLVDEDTPKTVDKQKLYDEFADPTKNPNYIRMIFLDEEMTVVDNVEDYFPGPEYEAVSAAELDMDLLTLFIDSWENAAVMDYIWGYRDYDDYVAKYITEDKKYFICYYDYTRTRNYGCGVCHQPNVDESPDLFYHVEEYASVGVDITNGHSDPGVSKCEVSKVMQVQAMLIQNTFIAEVEAKLNAAGIVLQQHQKDALVDIAYQYGPSVIDDYVTAHKNGNPESFWVFQDTTYSDRNANRLHLYKTGEYLDKSGRDLKEKLQEMGGSISE